MAFISQFTILITSNLTRIQRTEFSKIAEKAKIPMVDLQTRGFYGVLSLQIQEHTGALFIIIIIIFFFKKKKYMLTPVIESHPEGMQDFRLQSPWSELMQLANSIDLDSLNSHDRGHCPYILLLLIFMERWKNTHGGSPPSTSAEKKEFKELMTRAKQHRDEENFDEAISGAWRLFKSSEVINYWVNFIQSLTTLGSFVGQNYFAGSRYNRSG